MLDYRTENYTMDEFNALDRNTDGDLINMFDNFLYLTEEHVSMLTTDDHTRYYDYQEELDYELAMLREEGFEV